MTILFEFPKRATDGKSNGRLYKNLPEFLGTRLSEMAKGRETNVENLFKEALREQIGEKRYSQWFGDGVRFAFSKSGLEVRVESSSFICNWLRNTFKHTLEQLCRDFFGRVLPVEFLYVGDDADDAFGLVGDGGFEREVAVARQTKNVGFANRSDFGEEDEKNERVERLNGANFSAPTGRSLPTETRLERGAPEFFNEGGDANAVSPPKKRRGRPPKAQKTLETKEIASQANVWENDWRRGDAGLQRNSGLSVQNSNDYNLRGGVSESGFNAFGGGEFGDFGGGLGRESDDFDERRRLNAVSAQNTADESPTPRRRRGRPRKNPLPETPSPSAVDRNRSVPIQNAFGVSFSSATNVGGAAASNENAFGGDWDLSESERVAWAAGDFNDANDFSGSDGDAKTPGKRGRKKSSETLSAVRVGSSARTSGAGRTLFDVDGGDFSDDDEDVLRDERGFNIVKKTPSVSKRSRPEVVGANWASLDSFVEGPSNQLARKVVEIAIVEPSTLSPIFLYGPTSVGKTHLLEGVCDRYRRVPNRKPPLLMTAEEFTSAFIQSIQQVRGGAQNSRGGGTFRERFRNISLFALDDLHFLEGKTSTQTELLNVVDFLRSRRVQMIFTANRPLAELTKLRGELTTRIESGFVGKIENPERETLSIIFRRMAFERRLEVPDDVCRYVVSRFATHARQLSGALNRLFAAHLTTGAPINLHLAQEALADMAAANVRSVKLEDVERVVRETFGLDADSLKSKSRSKRCADPRALAMWLARKHTRSALAEIGKFFGGRQHSAVLSAQKKVDVWLKTNEELDAGGTVLLVSDAVERMERSLARPKI